jgi:putative ABC transport system permease protein
MLDSLRLLLTSRRHERRLESDMREEMLAHIALCAEDNVAAGMDPLAAQRAAEEQFGDLERLIVEGKRARRDPQRPLGRFPKSTAQSPASNIMNDLLSDIRFGIRMLLKSPVFSLVAIVSLGVGIGFNTTMFTVIDAVLFRPFPAADADRVVRLSTDGPNFGAVLMSYPNFRDVREATTTMTGVTAARTELTTFNQDGEVEFLFGESVSHDFFDVLGIPPRLGRTFAPDEELVGNHRVAMVSERFWRDRLGADESMLGETLHLGGHSYTLIGVVPERFKGVVPPLEVAFWAPSPATLDFAPALNQTSLLERRGSRSFHVFGRLDAAASLAQADAEVEAVSVQLEQEFADTNEDVRFSVIPAADVRIDPAADRMMLPAAGVLMVLVGLVLLLACANVANMMLARGTVRRQEIGIRMALGAGRGRLVRQMLTESMILSAVGALLAIVLARVALRLLMSIQPPVMVPVSLAIEVNFRVWLFTGLIALLTGTLFGLIPALRSTQADLSQSLRGDEAGDGGQLKGSRLRSGLVVAQVTLSLVLLVSASLMVRSLQNAQSIDPGIATESIVSLSPGLPFQGYTAPEARDFHLRAQERMAGVPGVTRVAYAERLPLDSTVMVTRSIYPEGRIFEAGETAPQSMTTAVGPAYFGVMGIAVESGRSFSDADIAEAPPVVVINRVLADALWPGENPVGKRLSMDGADGDLAEVVGIHAEHKVSTLGEDPTYNVYLPYAQDAGSGFGNLIAEIQGDPAAVLAGMRRVIEEMDPVLAVMEAETIAQHLSLSLFPVRLSAAALGLLGLVGALLAAVGVYGVVAFAVSRRTREIGIRMAIGADRLQVIRMVIRQGMRLVLIGAVIGLALSLAFTRLLSAMLYGVSATDGLAFIAAASALLLIGVLANMIPALRASHVDPSNALRSE